jgi:betaine-aldehyde dehydrogenase
MAGSGGQIDVVNPATEEVLFSVADASEHDVDRAVGAARRAFDHGPWSQTTLEERISVLEKALHLLASRREEIAESITAQLGAPVTGSGKLVEGALVLFRLYLDAASEIDYEFVRRGRTGQVLVRREPVGVVASITAWNGPLTAGVTKLVPALIAGCTAVAKPAPEAPAEIGLLAELLTEAGLPDGVLNVVHGGREAGQHLVRHPGVDKVAFTGSTAAGRWIGETCGARFARVSLELGGKSAAIVLDDVDVAQAVPEIAMGNFWNAGQACIAPTRVLVPRSRQDELVDALRDAAAGVVVGDPRDERTQMGPLVAERQRARVESYFRKGVAEGAKVVYGARRPPDLARGWFVEPTVFSNVDNSMTIAREEIFGPVMSVIAYDTEDDAVEIANDTDYGLHGCVFTRDLGHGLEVARRIRSGSVTLNGYGLTPLAPFGGVKQSGIGREKGGVEGIAGFLEYKSYIVPAAFADELEARGVPAG